MNKNKRILIMEDIPFWGVMLCRMLAEIHIEADWVKNGKEGLKKVEKGEVTYDGIITDVEMPLMDGLEATRKIRELGFKKPIIGFSSLGLERDVNDALDVGMDAYYSKSMDIKELQEVLKSLKV